MWKTWTSWVRATIGSVALWGTGGAVSYWQAYATITKPPEPGIVELCRWAFSGQSTPALIAATAAGIGMIASLVQLFGPKPLGESLALKLFARVERNADRRQGEIEGAVWTEGQASEARDQQAGAKLDEILLLLKAQGGAGDQQLATAARTVVDLAASPELRDREIANEITAGDPASAFAALIGEANISKLRNAERFRQAARIIAPFQPSKALEAYKEATDLDPTDVWSWIELGRLRATYESLANARRCIDQALQHVTTDRDRGVLDIELGNLAVAAGDLAEARRRFEAGLVVAERLAAQEPDNADWQRDLVVSNVKLGDVAVASGNLGAARDRFAAGLIVSEGLSEQEPDNSGWQRDLSVIYSKLGDVAVASGDLSAARDRYAVGLMVSKRLATREPGNAEWQRDLSVSYDRLGDVAVASGDLGAARDCYAAGLAVVERLAAQDPGNAEMAARLVCKL